MVAEHEQLPVAQARAGKILPLQLTKGDWLWTLSSAK